MKKISSLLVLMIFCISKLSAQQIDSMMGLYADNLLIQNIINTKKLLIFFIFLLALLLHTSTPKDY